MRNIIIIGLIACALFTTAEASSRKIRIHHQAIGGFSLQELINLD